MKALYGLKQAPRAWYMTLGKYLVDHGFQRDPDSNLYVKQCGDDILFLVVYVDDQIITRSSTNLIEEIKQNLCHSFDMTNLGHLHYCLGVEVCQTKGSNFISQSKYARSFLYTFWMNDSKSASTPMEKGLKLPIKSDSPRVDESAFKQLVGSLIYDFISLLLDLISVLL